MQQISVTNTREFQGSSVMKQKNQMNGVTHKYTYIWLVTLKILDKIFNIYK